MRDHKFKVHGREMRRHPIRREKKCCNHKTDLNCRLKAHQLKDQLEKCSFCDVSSPKSGLRQHMKKHDADGIKESDKFLSCQYCNLEVAGKRYLNAHLQRKHRGQHTGDFSCQFCDYSSTLVALGQHTYLEHEQEGVKICKHCGFQTTSASKLGRHRLDVHGNTRGRRKLEIDCIDQELVIPVNEVYKEIAS